MTALLIGSTGATGKDLLQVLINDKDVLRIEVFARRELNIQNNKINLHIIDFDKPEEWKHLVKGDVLFSCLGTTLKAAGSKAEQKKVDYQYQYQFAKTARENGVESLVLVSSDYASAKSPVFYSRIKGELEEDVKMLNFPKLIIFNPPILIRKGSDRKAEVLSVKIISILNSLGLFRSFRPLPTELLAKAMVNSFKRLNDGAYSVKGRKIYEFL
ncbi:MAG: NAD(P)H-binding protein [Bacteroidales bacterium]|nr:NAD(P)H-binding protein [Bacteroidales bacterium]MDD2424638.1 NAD(P)H-binding protein [Bacteroidales bacterium]MDD3989142.1 NAD(P)H-binding protein [Bacteroidales bacterium]MDD4638424.1 NAD(P)H-binding protein [Bacteroidales bacterium]